jgi:hypothetical protein
VGAAVSLMRPRHSAVPQALATEAR